MSKSSIRTIQTALRDLRYDPGPADGLFGPRTAAAAQAWIAARGQAAPVAAQAGAPRPPAMIWQGSARYPVTEIVIHCAATRPGWMVGQSLASKVAEIRRWHMRDRGWKDIGYHGVIDRDGAYARGRDYSVIGAHVVGHNTGTIGLCLLGGHGSAATDSFADHYTPAQDAALRRIIAEISGLTR
ncbi:MAG: N-acetylmuramoyl-L-alanine amidase, partial [Paracoccus sp. (in: a-proteobacteria)]|nr:N-acetylmuramoyl-L-alanine amidase [Paracoccus sp. (in: a-proteobacteria)]